MPKFSLLLGRRTVRVYDLDQTMVRVGRGEGADILIDNPAISRAHAEFRREGEGWVVEDLGSSNGTFVEGVRIDSPRPVSDGDEIGFGKFSVVFGRAVGSEATPTAQASMPGSETTTRIKAHELRELVEASELQRQAHIVWESGGRTGHHYLSEAPAALFGTDELCDVIVPEGPEHHVLVTPGPDGYEIRNLHGRVKMSVGGEVVARKRLADGDVVEAKGLKLTFVDSVGASKRDEIP